MKKRDPLHYTDGNYRLHWMLNERMQEKGYRSLSELHRQLQATFPDAISFSQLARLSSVMPEKLNTSTLLGLCVILDCNVGDLLRFEPVTTMKGPTS